MAPYASDTPGEVGDLLVGPTGGPYRTVSRAMLRHLAQVRRAMDLAQMERRARAFRERRRAQKRRRGY